MSIKNATQTANYELKNRQMATDANEAENNSYAKMLKLYDDLSRVMRNPVSGVSDQDRHKPGGTATGDG